MKAAFVLLLLFVGEYVYADWTCIDNQTAWDRTLDYNIDREELLILANTMDFPNWSTKRNWKNESVSFCDWAGLCCLFDGEHNRLTEIHLERNNLKGTFTD